jgi:hypothetical protein
LENVPSEILPKYFSEEQLHFTISVLDCFYPNDRRIEQSKWTIIISIENSFESVTNDFVIFFTIRQ